MCNCGKKRAALAATQHAPVLSRANDVRVQNRWADIHFEYSGLSTLTITGRVTGKLYRFARPRDVQLVDYRDATAFMSIPVLQKINF